VTAFVATKQQNGCPSGVKGIEDAVWFATPLQAQFPEMAYF
jgi:hypothetical protein